MDDLRREILGGQLAARHQAVDRALADLEAWVECGRIKMIEDVVEGFEGLPAALVGLLAGENIGKRLVRAC